MPKEDSAVALEKVWQRVDTIVLKWRRDGKNNGEKDDRHAVTKHNPVSAEAAG